MIRRIALIGLLLGVMPGWLAAKESVPGLVGTWQLVSRVDHDGDGKVVPGISLGPDAYGYLIYDSAGHVSSQLSARQRGPTACAAVPVASTNNSAPICAYDAYFGRYEVETSITGVRVRAVLQRLAETRGLPASITVDHGSEFEGQVLDAWAYSSSVRLSFIRPGKPNENAYIVSFNGKFRDECLNEHWFVTMAQARRIIETWRAEYNTERPHSSLGDLTPEEYADQRIAQRHEALSLTADSRSERD